MLYSILPISFYSNIPKIIVNICCCSLYNHYEDGSLRSVADMKGYQKIAIAFNGGTSEHWNDPEKVNRILILHVLYVYIDT